MFLQFFVFPFLANTFKFQGAFDFVFIIVIDFDCCDVIGLIVYVWIDLWTSHPIDNMYVVEQVALSF